MQRTILTHGERDTSLLVILFLVVVFSLDLSLFLIIVAALTGSEILLLFWHDAAPHFISQKGFLR